MGRAGRARTFRPSAGASELNLIVAKTTRVEINLLTPEGLQPMLDVPIYGRVACMELFRPPGKQQELLFISTERYKFCVLAYDASTGELVTRANGDAKDRIGRPSDFGQRGVIDPDCRVIGLHLYDGLFKCIPVTPGGQLKEAFNIRLEELRVLDIQFLHGCAKPTVAVLYHDTKGHPHVKTYVVDLATKDFSPGPWAQPNLDIAANMLIPVPMGGAIIVGEQTIMYHDGDEGKAAPIHSTIIQAAGRVDDDGSRYLLSDHLGNLLLLVLSPPSAPGSSGGGTGSFMPRLERLGTTSAAVTLSYLDNGVVFVGSSHGDSMLVKLLRETEVLHVLSLELERLLTA